MKDELYLDLNPTPLTLSDCAAASEFFAAGPACAEDYARLLIALAVAVLVVICG
jgi:hypothetical protein